MKKAIFSTNPITGKEYFHGFVEEEQTKSQPEAIREEGCKVNVAYGADRVRKLIMTDKVHQQMLAIRDGGLTNMFDTATVQRLAYDAGYFELVAYIEEHQKEYCCFIMTGKED